MGKDIENIALDFINTLQHRNSAEGLLNFYHPDIEQIEFPNALTKFTAVRNLSGLKAASEKGKQVLQKEDYKVIKSYSF